MIRQEKYITSITFEQWANNSGKILKHNMNYNPKYKHFVYVIIPDSRVFVIDCRSSACGIAKCHEDDEFSEFVGIAIAFYRMMGWELPRISERIHITQLENGDEFTSVKYDSATLRFIGFDHKRRTMVARSLTDNKLKEFSLDAIEMNQTVKVFR